MIQQTKDFLEASSMELFAEATAYLAREGVDAKDFPPDKLERLQLLLTSEPDRGCRVWPDPNWNPAECTEACDEYFQELGELKAMVRAHSPDARHQERAKPFMTQKYDIIGDIHGHATQLKDLLTKLGYGVQEGVFRHPERKVIFLGDYIDRGPEIRETLQIVRAMVDGGSARAIMGNHEFNALAFHTADGRGGYLRPHTKQNLRQHQATLEQIAVPRSEEWRDWLQWFATLPLFLELPGLRAVHAAWNPRAAATARSLGPLNPNLLAQMVDEETELSQVKFVFLNGPEITLPDGYFTVDREQHRRKETRVRWWTDLSTKTYWEAAFPPIGSIPHQLIDPERLDNNLAPYPIDEVPIFFGHYWMSPGTAPAPLAKNVACLDYSLAKGGFLTAYRWDGEHVLGSEKFVSVR